MVWRVNIRKNQIINRTTGDIIQLPRGNVFTREVPMIEQSENGLISAKGLKGQSVQIYPYYEKSIKRKEDCFRIHPAISKEDIQQAELLLANRHGRGVPTRGMILCLRSIQAPDELIGAAVISEVYHTSPLGRGIFLKDVFGQDWQELPRNVQVQKGRITCATRFAISENWVNCRLAMELSNSIAEVSSGYRWPPANFVEVFRWMSAEKYDDICCGSRVDFLTSSHYVPVPIPKRRVKSGKVAGYYFRKLNG